MSTCSIVTPMALRCSMPVPTKSLNQNSRNHPGSRLAFVLAKSKPDDEAEGVENTTTKESLFTSITNALDFSQTRSEKDAQLIEMAREATKSGEKMTPEQYSALRRKIGGTYKDFFKESIEAKGAYIDSGWVDKRCKICRKDTSDSPRSKDEFGRYAHIECIENRRKSGNFFTRLFGR